MAFGKKSFSPVLAQLDSGWPWVGGCWTWGASAASLWGAPITFRSSGASAWPGVQPCCPKGGKPLRCHLIRVCCLAWHAIRNVSAFHPHSVFHRSGGVGCSSSAVRWAERAAWGINARLGVPPAACPSPWRSCESGQQQYWLFSQRTDEGFDFSSFQLELNTPDLSVAVKRIVLWISLNHCS